MPVKKIVKSSRKKTTGKNKRMCVRASAVKSKRASPKRKTTKRKTTKRKTKKVTKLDSALNFLCKSKVSDYITSPYGSSYGASYGSSFYNQPVSPVVKTNMTPLQKALIQRRGLLGISQRYRAGRTFSKMPKTGLSPFGSPLVKYGPAVAPAKKWPTVLPTGRSPAGRSPTLYLARGIAPPGYVAPIAGFAPPPPPPAKPTNIIGAFTNLFK